MLLSGDSGSVVGGISDFAAEHGFPECRLALNRDFVPRDKGDAGDCIVALRPQRGVVLGARDDMNALVLDQYADELLRILLLPRSVPLDEGRQDGLDAELMFKHQRPARIGHRRR
jgi:hypothetical protein